VLVVVVMIVFMAVIMLVHMLSMRFFAQMDVNVKIVFLQISAAVCVYVQMDSTAAG
jgi:hypothetical protein